MEKLAVKKIISLMSGTSCDSIDAGFCEVYPDFSVKLIKGINHPYPDFVREMIFKAFRCEITIKELCQLNFMVGHCFAQAANILIKELGKPDLIASHGQTVWHEPCGEDISRSTLQIGENSVIAQQTACSVVSNFREKDIAYGGQGAPLVCFADSLWFKGLGGALVQNIGGIANVTVVSESDVFGFDTGAGNIMIDYCAKKFFNQNYDKDGKIAASGIVDEKWLKHLLKDEYYSKKPPKTTGREHYSKDYIERVLSFETAPDDPRDIIATLSALSAKTITDAYKNFIFQKISPKVAIIGGGGAYNKTLMQFLREYLPPEIALRTHEDFGISNNFKEVMAFALLGYCRLYDIPNNVPSATGAREAVVLGKLVY